MADVIQAGVSGTYDTGIDDTADDWYAGRSALVGRTQNPWSERNDWGQGEDQSQGRTYDPNPPAQVSGPISQADLAREQSYAVFGAPDNQAAYGDKRGGSPQELVVAWSDPNDTDGTWETDGVTGPLTGSTPGSNPVGGGTQDVAQFSWSSPSFSDLAK
jgi:hypothetical protein